MTMSSSVSKVTLNGDGVQTSWPFSFKVWKAGDLEVSITNAAGVTTVVSNWSVVLAGVGGTVTYPTSGSPLPSGSKITIARSMDFLQDVDLVSGTRWDPEVVETALDQATAERQQLKEKLERAFVVDIADSTTPEALLNAIFEARDTAVDNAASALDSAERAEIASSTAAYYNHEGTLLNGEDTITLPWAYDTQVGVAVFLAGVKQTESSLTFTDAYTVTLNTPVSADTDFEIVSEAGVQSDLANILLAPSGSISVGFLQSGTGAVARTVQGKLRDVVHVKDFGAIGDGVTDDTAAIQAAIDEVGGGTINFEKNRNYRITSAIEVSESNLKIIGNGSTIDGSAIAAASALNEVFGLKIYGAWDGYSVAVTDAISEGSAVVTCADSSVFSVGDMVLVYSTSENFPDVATVGTTMKGCLHKIRAINSATEIQLFDGVLFDYESTSDSRIRKIAPVENVIVENLSVKMGGIDKAHNGILISFASNIVLDNCKTDQTEDTGVRIEYTWGCKVDGGKFTNCNSPADGSSGVTGNTGYGVYPSRASRNIHIHGASFAGCRHAIAGGSDYPPSHVVVERCFVAGGRSPEYGSTYQLDCHEDCIYWTFINNHVAADSAATGCSGIMIRGQKASVIDNVITNPHQYGILVQNYDNPSVISGVNIVGNTISHSRLSGIRILGSSTAMVLDAIIKDNKIIGAGGDGIGISGAERVSVSGNIITEQGGSNTSAIRLIGTAFTDGNQCKDVIVSSNICESSPINGLRANYTDGLVVNGNVFLETFSESISLTDCKSLDLSSNRVSTYSASRNGVYVSGCTDVSISGGVCVNTNASPLSTSAGVMILGASSDISIAGVVAKGYGHCVRSVSPANYIAVSGCSGRQCTIATVDVSASTNTAIAGNL